MPAGRRSRFWRGFAAAFVIFGALNAASYFVRSEDGGNLVGVREHRREAMGFPCLFWLRGHVNSRYSLPSLVCNLTVGLSAACAAGAYAARRRHWPEGLAALAVSRPAAWQFSTRGLFLLTTIFAIIAAAVRSLVGHPWLLHGIVLLGPAALVTIVCCIQRLGPPQRVATLFVLTAALAAAAVAAGEVQIPHIDAERVLLAIFVCWLPQYTLIGVVISANAVRRTPVVAVETQRSAG